MTTHLLAPLTFSRVTGPFTASLLPSRTGHGSCASTARSPSLSTLSPFSNRLIHTFVDACCTLGRVSATPSVTPHERTGYGPLHGLRASLRARRHLYGLCALLSASSSSILLCCCLRSKLLPSAFLCYLITALLPTSSLFSTAALPVHSTGPPPTPLLSLFTVLGGSIRVAAVSCLLRIFLRVRGRVYGLRTLLRASVPLSACPKYR